MAYERKDRFYKKAKDTGFRSRAAFKILEINKKFRLFKPGMSVIDLGCWPGSWLQVIAREVGLTGRVIGVDLEVMNALPEKNVTLIRGDIRQEYTKQRLLLELGCKVDVLVSDMAPNLTGIKFQDQFNSFELAHEAFKLCRTILKEKGSFVAKIFPGEEAETFMRDLRSSFGQLKVFSPEATRKTSDELYLVATGFKNEVQK